MNINSCEISAATIQYLKNGRYLARQYHDLWPLDFGSVNIDTAFLKVLYQVYNIKVFWITILQIILIRVCHKIAVNT